MARVDDAGVLATVKQAARPLIGAAGDYDALMDVIGDARFVLIGEASHGTHEFYQQRAEITKRLIREKGFTAVGVEADWPDAYGLTGSSGAAATTRMRRSRSRTSSAFLPGCGETPRYSSSSGGCGPTTMPCVTASDGRASMAWTSTAFLLHRDGHPVPGQGGPRCGEARSGALLPVSTTTVGRPSPTDTWLPSARGRLARMRW